MRPQVLLIDFDDTCATESWPFSCETGKLKPYAKEAINKLHDDGYYIIIWTARFMDEHIEDVKNFLTNNGVKYDKINENCPYLEYKPYPKAFGDTCIDDNCLLNIDWRFIPYYVSLRNFSNPRNNRNPLTQLITDDMREYFYYRTINHIQRVIKFTKKFIADIKLDETGFGKDFVEKMDFEELYNTVIKHDSHKFSREIIVEYALLTEKMRCKFGREQFLPYMDDATRNELSVILKQATSIHRIENKHHPDYWKFTDRTEPIDDYSLVEMCADYCAMSEENRNEPLDFFYSNVVSKYNFSKSEIYKFEKIIEKMWRV